jgi:light-regulated signal transduction histidine kinase (bacteriophytochrome)
VVVAELRARDPARQVAVVVAEGLVASGDRGLLRIVLENLLGNAWKFTRKAPRACIEIGSEPPGADNEPIYFVRDNGAGFDMAHAEKLFAPFQRLHSNAEFQGTGVGLATVQRIIHRHGGRVWAEAEPQRGATFFFTLGEAGS